MRGAANHEAHGDFNRRWLLWVALGGALLLAVACRHVQFSPDSIHYADVARTLLSEHTAATYHLTLKTQHIPDPMLYWPPGYPLALAAVMAAGASVQTAAWVVAAVSWTAALVLLVGWLRRAEWGLLGAVAFVYLIFVCGVAFRAWSEGPYSALMLGALVCMAAALASAGQGRIIGLGLAAGALAGAATLCRYPGIVLVPALALAALVAPLSPPYRGRARWSALVAMLLGAIVVIGPWVARNIWLTGLAFGPQRPPGQRSLMSIFSALGASIYLDFGAVLLAFLFAAVGYHRARSTAARAEAPEHSFLRALATVALLCAGTQLVFMLFTHILWQLDEPLSKRYIFPSYLPLLMAGLALIAMAAPPERVLRRRWPLVLVLALPLVVGPMMAGMASHDVTPRSTALESWIEANTASDALIIGYRVWPVRFYTGRPVLQSGQAADPSVYDGTRVAAFVSRFGNRFSAAYLLLPDTLSEAEQQEVLRGYQRAGLQLQETADVPMREHDGTRQFVMHVFRVEAPSWGND